MNSERATLIKRLEEAGISLRRFLKIDEEKKAFEPSWQTHLYTPNEIDGYPRWGIAGREGLVLIDTDNEEMAKIIGGVLPKTFVALSPRRRLPHFYFSVSGGDIPNAVLHLVGDKKGSGEIRAQNLYLVAPGTEIEYTDFVSGKEKTGKYTILHDRPIAKTSIDSFMTALSPYLGGQTTQPITFEQMRTGVDQGMRHAQGIKYATFLIAVQKFDELTAFQEMKRWNVLNRPPMPEHDLERMVRNAARYAKRTQPKPDENGKEFDILALANELLSRYRFVTHEESQEIFIYEDGIYKPRGEVVIQTETQRSLGPDISTHRVREVVDYVRRETYKKASDFNSPPAHLLNLKNGILDLETFELRPHSPDHLFLNQVPVEYNPEARYPTIEKFFSEIVRPEDVELLKEIVGFCLAPTYFIHKALLCVGPGKNGKSTFLGLVREFLGRENVSVASLHEFGSDRFATYDLFGKFANICADIPTKRLTNTSMFKQLAGEDQIRAQKKYHHSFGFVNRAKLLFSCNWVPASDDETEAFFSRWLIIDFPNVFEEDKADPNLLKKLTTPEGLSALLALALGALKRLQTQNRFSQAKTTEEIREDYERKSDPIKFFVGSCIELDSASVEPKEAVYRAFVNFCYEHKLPICDKGIFSRQITKNIPIEETRVRIGGRRTQAWKGARLIGGYARVTLDTIAEKKSENGGAGQPGQTGQPISYPNFSTEDVKINKGRNTPDRPDRPDRGTSGKTETYVRCRFTEEVPYIFVGEDLKLYGPFERGAAVELPLKNAELLAKKGIVVV